MSSVSTILNDVQRELQDAEVLGTDGMLWTRAELLNWLRDGYQRLLAQSQGQRRLRAFDMPPRTSFSYTYPWERQHLQGGTGRQVTYSTYDSRRQVTTLWEIESRAGLTPTEHYTSVTQLWELAHVDDIDAPYRFHLPRHHEKVNALWWDHKRLNPVSVRELDALDTAWQRQDGEPFWWTMGTGETRSLEVYEVQTDYQQAYEHGDWGVVRTASGDRTYTQTTTANHAWAYTTSGEVGGAFLSGGAGLRITQDAVNGYQGTQLWEKEMLDGETTFTDGVTIGTAVWEAEFGATNVGVLPLGTTRAVSSPDRQYWSQDTWRPALGTVRAWNGSDGAMLVWETIIPILPDLVDAANSTPEMVPERLHKYLRYYVLFQAYDQQGEGYNPNQALHWQHRWLRGVRLMRRCIDVTWRDMRFRREPITRTRRMVPSPQLPSDYPRVPWLG